MYKTILSLLITLLVTTLCLAQGVKAEEPATLDGTEWKFVGEPNENIPVSDDSFSFYAGKVYETCPTYGCKEAHQPNYYVSGRRLSLFSAGHRTLDRTGDCENKDNLIRGIMSPVTGIGIIYYESGCFLARKRGVAVLEKVSDNWKPPENVE